MSTLLSCERDQSEEQTDWFQTNCRQKATSFIIEANVRMVIPGLGKAATRKEPCYIPDDLEEIPRLFIFFFPPLLDREEQR